MRVVPPSIEPLLAPENHISLDTINDEQRRTFVNLFRRHLDRKNKSKSEERMLGEEKYCVITLEKSVA